MALAIESLTEPQKTAMRAGIGIGEPNAANGFPQLDEDGHLVGTLIHRIGTDDEIDAIVLAAGETAYTTDTFEHRVGDGVTAGGIFVGSKARTFTDFGQLSVAGTFPLSVAVKPGRTYQANFHFECSSACTPQFGISANSLAEFADSISFPGFGLGVRLLAFARKMDNSVFTVHKNRSTASTTTFNAAGNLATSGWVEGSAKFAVSANVNLMVGGSHASLTTQFNADLELRRIS